MEYLRKPGILKVCLVLYSYFISYIYVDLFFEGLDYSGIDNAIVVVLISLGFVVWLELVMLLQKVLGKYKPSKSTLCETRFWEVILILLAATTHFGADNELTSLAMHIVVIYMVLCGTGHLYLEESSCFLPFDLLNGGVRIPFSNIIARISMLVSGISDIQANKKDKKVVNYVRIIAGVFFLLIAIVVFFRVFVLLGELDSKFYAASLLLFDKLENIFEYFDNLDFLEKIGTFIISIPVGLYLSGLYLGSAQKSNEYEQNQVDDLTQSQKKLMIIPEIIINIVCVMFVAMYILFFISQSRLLFSGFLGILPIEFTASAYARDGFSQLATVLIINFLGLAVIRLFSERSVTNSKSLKIGSVALMITSMIFAVISSSKIILYISRFGYTDLRAESLWFTVVAFVGSLLVIVNIVKGTKTLKVWLWFSAMSFVIMNIIAGICQMSR